MVSPCQTFRTADGAWDGVKEPTASAKDDVRAMAKALAGANDRVRDSVCSALEDPLWLIDSHCRGRRRGGSNSLTRDRHLFIGAKAKQALPLRKSQSCHQTSGAREQSDLLDAREV